MTLKPGLLHRAVGAVLLAGFALLSAEAAHAVRLEVADEAPFWAHAGAAVLLILHIGGGAVGLVSGTAAVAARKGSAVHRKAGKVFFVSMFIAYLIGAGVAPFLTEGQRPNFIGGVLALYLLISGVVTARRRHFQAGTAERVGLVIALMITAMGAWFTYLGLNSPTGTIDNSPPQAFILFIVAGSAAAAGEINALVKGQLSELARQSRHLWRMCTSFFIASGSLFFGQPQVFPGWFNDSFLPAMLSFAPLLVLLYWLIRTRLVPRFAG